MLFCAVGLTGVLAACAGSGSSSSSATPSPTPSTVTVTELPAKISVPVGTKIEVVLEENASTGYTWSVVPPLPTSDLDVLSVGSPKYEAGPAVPGAPGVSRTVITALNPGTAVAVFRYSPPNQQASPKSPKRLTVTVTA